MEKRPLESWKTTFLQTCSFPLPYFLPCQYGVHLPKGVQLPKHGCGWGQTDWAPQTWCQSTEAIGSLHDRMPTGSGEADLVEGAIPSFSLSLGFTTQGT